MNFSREQIDLYHKMLVDARSRDVEFNNQSAPDVIRLGTKIFNVMEFYFPSHLLLNCRGIYDLECGLGYALVNRNQSFGLEIWLCVVSMKVTYCCIR